MPLIKSLAASALMALSIAQPAIAQEDNLTIAVGFGPTAEVQIHARDTMGGCQIRLA
jgi:hypothetical protein